jgi:hypothetical protein
LGAGNVWQAGDQVLERLEAVNETGKGAKARE